MPRTPIHPGEILGDELEEIGLSAKIDLALERKCQQRGPLVE
jgi:plasmid maintenance system antidote protein VapI